MPLRDWWPRQRLIASNDVTVQPFRERLAEGMNVRAAWKAAVEAGLAGAEATKAMKPRLGRASYLGDRAVGHPGGAVGIWLAAIG